MNNSIYFEPGLKPVIKFNPNHDEKGRFSDAQGGSGSTLSVVHDLQNFDPNAPIPASPKNAGGMTSTIWNNWEHGPDGNQYVTLYRQYAAEALGLQVPKSDMAPGGALNYLTQRGFGGSSTETAKGHALSMLNAIANGSPSQPALYRGIVASPYDASSQALVKQFSNLKAGDTIDMPLVSTTRSLGVASWYAADRVSSASDHIIMKIQPGAKGVSVAAKNSFYPADHEVVTSGKFEVVGVSHVTAPYWSRGVFEPRKAVMRDGTTHYEVATYSNKRYTNQEAKKIWDTVQAGKIQSLATDTLKFTNDRGVRSSGNPVFSSWTKQEPKNFTVVEVKMVEPHKVQKAADMGMAFDSLFNDRPFINDDPEAVQKFNPNHDDRGRFSSGSGMGVGVATSILERVKANGGLSVNMVDGSEPKTGYMVAKGTDLGATVSAADFYDPVKGPKILADYMKRNKADLGTGKNYLGLWHNTEDNNVYLDVSQNIQSKSEAITAGQLRDQISIWDVANMAEIQTGGTGVTKQEVGSGGTTVEYLRDDRFGDRGLRPDNLGKVSKTKVIYFEPGLKPVIKFNPYHDERGRFTTGTGYAQGGYTAEQTYRQNQMKGKGPTTAQLDAYMATTLGTQERIDASKAVKDQFNQIYGMKVNGLTSKVENVGTYDKKIVVSGGIYNSKNEFVGKFERQLTRQAGGFIVEHKLLKLAESVRGKGFAKKFIPASEAYYINNGFKRIDVWTGWDGARHWARAGYDWNPGKRAMKSTFDHLSLYAGARGFTDNATPEGRKFNELMSKVSPDWKINPLTGKGGFTTSNYTFHPKSDSFPIPNDFATIGYKRGATSWGGKTLLSRLNLYYSKPLTAKGMNIKTK